MGSAYHKTLKAEIKRLGKIYLNFSARATGNYTPRQLSSTAAYIIFCHAEFEVYLERWARKIYDHAEMQWAQQSATKPLVHLCTFHEGRGELSSVPKKDVWSEPIVLSLNKHKSIIDANNGIKESNVCRMFSPFGFDTRSIDSILLGDLNAFGNLRGGYAHGSHGLLIKNSFDPFTLKGKAENIVSLLEDFDDLLKVYFSKI